MRIARFAVASLMAAVLLAAAVWHFRHRGSAGANAAAEPPTVDAKPWTVEVARDSTVYVRYDGSRVMTFNYIAWGPNWKFAEDKIAAGKEVDGAFPISGGIETLGVTVGGSIKWTDTSLTYEWKIKADKESKGNIGAAVNTELRLTPDVFNASTIGKTELADGGWTWTPVKGQTVSAKFEGLPRPVAFEKGKADQLRAWFVPGDITPGERTVKMTLTFPAGTVFKGMPASRYAAVDEKTWLTNTLDWTTSPVDLSYLNDKPAGRRGFVKVDGDRFVFADGTEAKFWGCNVQAYSLFAAKDDAIQQQAKRIAALGYNLVRIHHHDSADWVTPNVFSKDAADTQHLDAAALDRIDYWVKCLKDQGVYVWMDLHVGRPFRVGDDIPGFDELKLSTKTGNRQAKGFNYVNPRVTDLMKDFAKNYLSHTNKYTGLTYLNEPAVMGVLITNENDITDHFGVTFLPDKKLPQHKAMYDKLRDPIVKALKLDAAEAWKTWEPGPSKVALNEVQYQWSKDFVDYLHTLGVKVPIATTNTWGSDPLFSLPALTAGDVIDVHSYGVAESLSSNPRHDSNSAFWITAAQVAGKPVTITEWNTPEPQRDRFTQPLYIAALAAFQGWDAPMIFGYQQSALTNPAKLAEWGTSNDPAITSLMPAAALMYRRGDVSPAKETVTLALPAETLLYKKVSPESSRALRTISERHKLSIAMPSTPLLPWLKSPPPVGQVITDANYDALPPDATSTESDTGQLKRNWGDGVFTIDTPRTQAAVGWIGGKTIALGDVTITLTTPKAAVVISAMDDQPIATSKKLLITVAAQASEKKKVGILAEPVVGDIGFNSTIKSVTALQPNGKAGTTTATDGSKATLTGRDATHWFIVTR